MAFLAFVCPDQQAVQEHVPPCFAVLPAGGFHLDMAAPADAGHENHGRGADLVRVARIVAGAANPEHIGIASTAGQILFDF